MTANGHGEYPWRFRFLGVHLKHVGPVRDAYLSLGEGTGLHVLYGRNGAGKTSVLKAFTDGSASLVVEAPELRQDFEHQSRGWDAIEYHLLDYLERNWRPSAWDEAGLPRLETVEADLEALAREFAAAGTFVLRGQTFRPAVFLSDDTPVASREAQRVRSASERVGLDPSDEAAIALERGTCLSDYWAPDTWSGEAFTRTDRPALALLPEYSSVVGASASAPYLAKLMTRLAIDESGVDVDHLTAACFAEEHPVDARGVQPSFWTSDAFVSWCEDVEGLANDIFTALLLGAPRLRLERPTPDAWFTAGLARWRAESAAGHLLGLDRLSGAEAKWAAIAVKVALRRRAREFVVLVLDEPEAGLHRSAESHLARGLAAIAADAHSLVVVSTHSPELLDAPGARLHHVRRAGDGASTIEDLDVGRLRELETYGLHASDLIRRQRVFLLVEGTHDEVVLTTMLGDELAAARVTVLPMRGARRLAEVIDSQFLFHYSDAKIITLLDNVAAATVDAAWQQAVVMAAMHGPDAASAALRLALPPKDRAEHVFLGEFLSKVLHEGSVIDRVIPYGLEACDVILYLPVTAFVPGARSWDSVLARHRAEGGRLGLKPWMSKTYGCAFDDVDTIRRAAEQVTDLPAEFSSLLHLCRSIGAAQ